MVISQRLKGALKLIGPKKPVGNGYKAIQILVWELMNTQSRLEKAEAKLAKLTAPKLKSAKKPLYAYSSVVKNAKKKKPRPNAIAIKSIFDASVSAPCSKNARTKVKLPKNFGKVK